MLSKTTLPKNIILQISGFLAVLLVSSFLSIFLYHNLLSAHGDLTAKELNGGGASNTFAVPHLFWDMAGVSLISLAMMVVGLGVTAILFLRFRRYDMPPFSQSPDKIALPDIPNEIEHYLMAMELAHDGVCIADENGHIAYVNDAFCKSHGYESNAGLIGKRWNILFDENTQEYMRNEISPILGKDKKWAGKAKSMRKDGSLFDAEISIITMPNNGFITVCRDISEETQAETVSSVRLAAIEAAKDGIWIVNERGILIFINKSMMDIHGIQDMDKDRYVGRHWENLYTKKERKHLKDNILPAYERYDSWNGEIPLRNLGGDVIHVELSLTKLPNGGMIGTTRDISQKKQNEEEKTRLKDQFYQSQKMEAIGQLAGGMAHDFNNILAAIMGYSEFLIEDLSKDADEYIYAKNIHSAGIRGRDLIDHMLAFSRRSETSHEIIDITDPLQETLKIMGASLPKSIEIQQHINLRHPFIMGNSTQIGQIMMNMCLNSKDAIADEPGTLSLGLTEWNADDQKIAPLLSDKPTDPGVVLPGRVKSLDQNNIHLYVGQLQKDGTYLKLSIEDTGCGITRAVAEHIFEPFYTTKAVNEGTGLGMAMVHGVVIEHGGAIFMESERGKGTRFDLFFPIVNANDDTEEEIKAPQSEIIQGKGHILIVEDQTNVRTMLEKMLERIGYSCESAEDAIVALDILHSPSRATKPDFDLIITDYTMPKMTGLAFAQKLLETHPNLPLIMVSGYSEQKLDKAVDLSKNIKSILRKPVQVAPLSNALASVLQKSKIKA